MRVGILGGGQLGRMLALAAYPLDVAVRVLEPATESSAAKVCPRIAAEFDDYAALYDLVTHADVITYEFENVPVESVHWLAERGPVFPSAQALEIAQDRLFEKQFFQRLGVPVPPFAPVDSREDFDLALQSIGFPAVLKTRRFGYDGKGQMVLRSPHDGERAWELLGGRPLILETFVSFDREVSLIGVRGRTGEIRFYPLTQNEHREGILYRSTAPAPQRTPELQHQAETYGRRALEELNYVGVLAIEFFEQSGRLWVNEMAPRVHNSAHWTIEGACTSQFENHLRAILGWPLGDTQARGVSVMLNLIGRLPELPSVLAIPRAHVHWYGKTPRPRRKVGHITCQGNDWTQAVFTAELVEKLIHNIE